METDMTRAEAIKVLEQIRQWTDYPKEALTMAIDALSKPEFSSDLDEAAEEFAWKKEEPLADGERLSSAFNPRIDALKAGAEWMAKQGYSYEDKVYLLDGGDTCESYPGLDGEGEKQCIDKAVKDGYLKVGDKVIVQIRKKKEDEK